jgi:hypothetical protein
MEAHEAWVGTRSAAASREHHALRAIAAEYRAMADAAGRAAPAMEAMRDVPPAPHDPARLDASALRQWMREKVRLQRELAALLLRHAEESDAALAAMAESDLAAR